MNYCCKQQITRSYGVPHAGSIGLAVRSAPLVFQWVRWTVALLLPVAGLGDIQTVTQTLSANVSPYGKISLPAGVSLRSPNTKFGTLSGTLTVNYWARTSPSGGGAVTVEAASDFSPADGPQVNSVSYTCSAASLGTGCSGAQSLNTSTQTSLVSLPAGVCTGGGGACSTQEPNSVLLTFSVPSKPQYKTGAYSAQITITISTM